MEKKLLEKTFGVEIAEKSENEDGSLHIKFYACCYNNVDSVGDVIVPTACDDFLKSEDAGRMKLCYQHNRAEVIGVITSMKSDDYGLLCEADVLATATGKDVITLLKAGAIDEFSIGYIPVSYHYEKRAEYDYEIRSLDAITIVEVSPVTRAANNRARLISAKSEDFAADLQDLSDENLAELKQAVDAERIKRLVAGI